VLVVDVADFTDVELVVVDAFAVVADVEEEVVVDAFAVVVVEVDAFAVVVVVETFAVVEAAADDGTGQLKMELVFGREPKIFTSTEIA